MAAAAGSFASVQDVSVTPSTVRKRQAPGPRLRTKPVGHQRPGPLQAVLSTGEKFLVAAGSVELAELQVIASAFQARPPASSIAAVTPRAR